MNPAERTGAMNESRWGSVRPCCGSASLGDCRIRGLALFLALWCGGTLLAQQPMPGGNGPNSSRPIRTTPSEMDQIPTGGLNNSVYQERRLRQISLAQHKAMVTDTERLLRLVTELNEEIDNSSPAALTPDQLRRVAEIEKLARSVKEKMRNTVQGTPVFLDERSPLSSPPGRR